MKKNLLEKSFSVVIVFVSVSISILASIFELSYEYSGSKKVVYLMVLAALVGGIGAGLMIYLARRKKKPESGRIFLIYANEDIIKAEELYGSLQKSGFKPWMSTKDILPGQNWEDSIRNAIERSDVALACLSRTAVEKKGFVQRELKYALDIMEERKEGISPVIPVRLENTAVPDRLKHLHWLDLFAEDGFNQLIRALKVATKTA